MSVQFSYPPLTVHKRYLKVFVTLCAVLFMSSASGAGGSKFRVSLEKSTNGVDADEAPGPELLVGSDVVWTFVVTNTGTKPLRRVNVYDFEKRGWFYKPVFVCTLKKLNVGESKSCERNGIAKEGQYKNTGVASVVGKRFWHRAVDSDHSHYLGTYGNPAIALQKYTESVDADVAPGPDLVVGNPVTWTFAVTNTGDVDLTNVVVSDEQVLPSPAAAYTVCELPVLAVGETQTCLSSGVVLEGQYENLGSAVGEGPGGALVSAQDLSHYTGITSDLASLPSASPTSGDAPLTVTFTPDASTNNAILLYEWDFDGDGTYDRSETVGRAQNFTYTTPGNYNAILRVTDANNNQAVGAVVINVGNQSPEVSVSVVPSNGQAPLIVNFTATAVDSDGISTFEWDYNGDGTFDETTTSGTTTFTYDMEGTYRARIRVTDTLGAATTLDIPTLEVNALPAGSPSVALALSPSGGSAPLAVTLSAAATDPDGGAITQYEWDVDGDGSIDQVTTVNSLQYTYTQVGTYYPRVRVTDSSGLVAEDAEKIFIDPLLSLSISLDTIEPMMSETSTISTSLGGDIEVSLIIENDTGETVRTLVPLSVRTSGSYDDVWDGLDDNGNVVPEGSYRAILLYRLDGELNRLDLALTTGGAESNPPRSSIPSSFSPMANDPLDITFTLSRASEVTAFMGLFNVNTRLVTFLQREPLGRGTHQVIWNGENGDGQLIDAPPGDRFLFGIFAYSLPDNAIYVRSGVHVTATSAAPSIYQPATLGAGGEMLLSEITVALSRAGDVKLAINDAETGSPVAEFTYAGLDVGSNVITWDGRDNNGDFVAPGTYRLGVSGLSENGFESLKVYALQRIYY